MTPDASVPRLGSFNFLKLPQNCFAELDVDVSLLSYFMDQLGGRGTTRRRRTPKKAAKLEWGGGVEGSSHAEQRNSQQFEKTAKSGV